jgi:hypothetical protein
LFEVDMCFAFNFPGNVFQPSSSINSHFESWWLFVFSGTGAWTRSLHLEPLHQPLFCDGFFSRWGLTNHKLFAWPGLNCDPTDLCLLSS